jgi:hypothetical protein
VTADGRSTNTNVPTAGGLVADLLAIEDWLDDIRGERPDDADQIDFDGECFGQYGATRIADVDGRGTVTLYTKGMGNAGYRYLGVKPE